MKVVIIGPAWKEGMLEQQMYTPKKLPLISLSGAVLFPGTYLSCDSLAPEHQELVLRCLAEGHSLVIALEQPMEQHLDGKPSFLCRVGTEAKAVRLRQMDGPAKILVQGMGRVLLREESLRTLPYRLARVRQLPDFGQVASEDVDVLRRCLGVVAGIMGPHGGPFALLATMDLSAENMADLACASLPNSAWSKQKVLEAVDRKTRVELATHMLMDFMARFQGMMGSDSLPN